MKSQTRLLVVLLAIMFCLTSTAVTAQISAQTLVNYPEVTEEEAGVNLRLYFNILDNTGQIVNGNAVQSATIVLDDGNRYDAEVEQPDTPFYIVLALDASGSMGGAAQEMQRAAIEFINNAPEEARFSVIRFNQQVDTLVENFTTDRNRAINAVGEVNPVNMSGTCLYDAAYSAVERLANAPNGRRAVILFTDGRDETAEPGIGCSTHTYSEVINLASQLNLRVPIYTIGYRGGQEINETELRNFALATGGVAAIGSQQTEIANLFGRMTAAINSQWMASTVVYPEQGTRTATLLVTLRDGTFPQPALTTFTVANNYEIPADQLAESSVQPSAQVSLVIDLFQFEPSAQAIQVRLEIDGAEHVAEYRFDVKNAATNLLVGEFVFSSPLTDIVEIPVGNLPDGEYFLQASAIRADGRIVGRTEDTRFTVLNPTATPTETPVPIGAALVSVQHNTAEASFILQLAFNGIEQLSSLQINLVNTSTNLQERSLTFSPAPTIEISTDGLTSGEYEIVVIAQDLSGQAISRSSQRVVYRPNTPTPTSSPPPIGAVIESVQYDAAQGAFVIVLDLIGADQIESLQINLINARTNLQERTFEVAPTREIQLPVEGLQASEYIVAVVAQSASGQVLNRDTRNIVPPTPTPSTTPTPTETPTATATPVQAQVHIDAVGPGDTLQEFVVQVSIENPELIKNYQISLTDNRTGLQVATFNVIPANGAIHVPLSNISAGEYILSLRATDENNRLVAEHSVRVGITATETPAPSPTVEPTLEPTPVPLLSSENLRNNQGVIIPIVVVIGVAVIALAVLLLRKPAKSSAATPFLNEPTGPQPVESYLSSYGTVDSTDPDATNAQIMFDPNATSPVPQLLLPTTRLIVERSRDSSRLNQTFIVDRSPFTLGRKGRDLDFDGDSNVSREHAEITYADGVFYITDRNSVHGTTVDSSPIPRGVPVPIYNDNHILLGTTTLLRFETEAPPFEPDKTNLQ